MKSMTGMVTADFRPSTLEIEPDRAGSRGWSLTSLLAAWRNAQAERDLSNRLAEMDDALLRDIGVADDEIFSIRNGARLTPRAWLAGKPTTRHLAARGN